MKKLLLIVLALSMGFLTYAQKGNRLDAEVQKTDLSRAQFDVADPGAFSMMNPYKPVNNTVKGTAAIEKYQISSSANVYTLLVTQSHCLTADQPSGVIMFTHRADPSAGLGTSSGDIVTSHSIDGGMTWTQNIVLQNSENNRYPSGVLYNPLGATSVDSLMAVWMGPAWHGPAGGEVWDQNYFGNSTLNGLIDFSQYIDNPVGEEVLIRMGFSACDDGYVHVMGPNYEYNGTTQYMDYRNTEVMTGVFNMGTMSFDWTKSVATADFFVNDATDGDKVGSYNMQWSQDGNIGWIYYTARDNRNDQFAYQPIAYYSTDKGATWTVKPFFDFGTILAIDTNFWSLRYFPSDPDKVVPTFYYWNDGVVDANGQLHIFLQGQGKYSLHPDSLNYSYLYEPDFLIDLHTTMTGWDAVIIDTVYAGIVPSDNSDFGDVGWTNRTQASRTKEGDRVFVVWSDTDTSYNDLNKFPDIIGWGMDVNTGEKTDVVNFTRGTFFSANNFFQYVSNITLRNGCEYRYTIPVSTADLGLSPDDPVGHYYLDGIELEFYCEVDAMFTAPDTVLADNPVNFTDASTGSPSNWEWVFGDGNTSTLQNPTHTYNLTGGDTIHTYTVILTAGNGTCCTLFEQKIVVVQSIGIKEIEANIAIDIYPNPAKDVLNISTTENIESIKIFNAFGRLVAEQIVNDNLVKINTSDFTPGMYFVQINTEVGFATRKINIIE